MALFSQEDLVQLEKDEVNHLSEDFDRKLREIGICPVGMANYVVDRGTSLLPEIKQQKSTAEKGLVVGSGFLRGFLLGVAYAERDRG